MLLNSDPKIVIEALKCIICLVQKSKHNQKQIVRSRGVKQVVNLLSSPDSRIRRWAVQVVGELVFLHKKN